MDVRGGSTPAGQSQLGLSQTQGLCWAHPRNIYSYKYVVEYLQQQYREYSTAQRNHPCTKQQTKYVLIRVHTKTSTGMYVHAYGVRVVFLEHGALGICKSPVCT